MNLDQMVFDGEAVEYTCDGGTAVFEFKELDGEKYLEITQDWTWIFNCGDFLVIEQTRGQTFETDLIGVADILDELGYTHEDDIFEEVCEASEGDQWVELPYRITCIKTA